MANLERTVWLELPLAVDFDVRPEDPTVGIFGDAIEINAVYLGEVDVTGQLTAEQMADIERQLWERMRETAEAALLDRLGEKDALR